jgi:hypothetical protein
MLRQNVQNKEIFFEPKCKINVKLFIAKFALPQRCFTKVTHALLSFKILTSAINIFADLNKAANQSSC